MAKNILELRLNEIKADGDSWFFDENSSDRLKEHLSPEINTEKYNISVEIKPIGNAFEILVNYKVSYELLCSKCAFEFSLPATKVCREILVVRQKSERIDHQKSTSKNWQDELFCTELDAPFLNLGDFLREVILIDSPSKPLGFGELCEQEACEPIKSGDFVSSSMDKWQSEEKNQPFSVLKDLMGKSIK